MADAVEVIEAVIERLRTPLAGWNPLLTEPTKIPIPAYLVELDPGKGADYAQVMGEFTQWHLRVTLFTNAIDEEASVRKLGPLTGTQGPLLRALKDSLDDYSDTLARLSNGLVVPSTLSGFKVVRRNNNRYRSATLAFTVSTN